MTTNQKMRRRMGSISIYQRTKDGFITDFDSLIRWLRQVWSRKQVPKVFKQ